MSSIYLEYSTLLGDIHANGVDEYKKWLNESISRLHQPIKYHDKNISPLSFAIHYFNPDFILWMLNKGVNKDGMLENGYGYYTSISSIILIDVYFINYIRRKSSLVPFTKSEKKRIFCMKQVVFDLLVLQGADMNIHGLNGKNLLALECGKPVLLIDVKWIKYILTKGMNPNIFNFISKKETILSQDYDNWFAYKRKNHKIDPILSMAWFFQPILIIYWSMINSILLTLGEKCKNFDNFFKLSTIKQIKCWDLAQIKKITYKVLSLLLFNGANIEQSQSDHRTLQQTMQWVENKYSSDFHFKYQWKKLNRPLTNVIKRCSKYDIPRIKHLQTILKMGNYNVKRYSMRTYLCSTITRKYEKLLNSKVYMNQNISSTCESTQKYSPNEIVEYTVENHTWAFHISEIPNLIKTQINPFTRDKITIDTIKEWYKILDNRLLPLYYPPLSCDEIGKLDLSKPILSRNDGEIIVKNNALEFDFSNVDDKNMLDIFESCSDANNMNSFIQKTIRKIRKKQLSISIYMSQRNKIKLSTKIINNTIPITGIGIYSRKFSNKIILVKIQTLLNNTAIGRYIHLISWLDSWPYVIIFKLFVDLYTYNTKILNENWSIILDIWKKRKSYTRYKMKRFFMDLFSFLVANGFEKNSLNINMLASSVIQLQKEFLYIKKVKKIVWKLYKARILTAFEIIENSNNSLFDYFKKKLPTFFNEIINTIKFDSYDLFNVKLNDLEIALHESPGFQYFETTLPTNTKHLAYFQWNLMEDDDKTPFIVKGMQIQENTEFKINTMWKHLQNLLYLVNNENFYIIL